MKYLITLLSLLWVMHGCKENQHKKEEWQIALESELTLNTKVINCCDTVLDKNFKILCNSMNGTSVISYKEYYLKYEKFEGFFSGNAYESASLSYSPFIIPDTCKAKQIVNAYVISLRKKYAENLEKEKLKNEKHISDSIYNSIHNIKNYKPCEQ